MKKLYLIVLSGLLMCSTALWSQTPGLVYNKQADGKIVIDSLLSTCSSTLQSTVSRESFLYSPDVTKNRIAYLKKYYWISPEFLKIRSYPVEKQMAYIQSYIGVKFNYIAPRITQGSCVTQNPVVMVHGIGWGSVDADDFISYWYDIIVDNDGILSNGGVLACNNNNVNWAQHTTQPAWGDYDDWVFGNLNDGGNWPGIVYQINQWWAVNWKGVKKINLVGHSMGGPTIRYLVQLAKFTRVAADGSKTTVPALEAVGTMTTISGVHRGSPVADWMLQLPAWADNTLAAIIKFVYNVFFDNGNADPLLTLNALSTKYMINNFNLMIPNDFSSYGIKCQWIAGSYVPYEFGLLNWKGQYDQILFGLLYDLMKQAYAYYPKTANSAIDYTTESKKLYFANNDGLVPAECAKFGTQGGLMLGDPQDCSSKPYYNGASHFNEINQFLSIVHTFTVPEWYQGLYANIGKSGN